MESDLSRQNNKILNELHSIIVGNGADAPGLAYKVNRHDELLLGKDGNPGIVQKVNMMWRIHVWVYCAMSAAAGFLFKSIITNWHL